MAVSIKTDYRNFGGSNSDFLSCLCPDFNFDIDIRPIESEGHMHSPFTTPYAICRGANIVEYSEMEISILELSTEERHACLMHEIGHIILRKIFPCAITVYLDSFFNESFCDMVALIAGLGENMISALNKMKANYPEIQDSLDRRINRFQEIYDTQVPH